MSRTVDQTKEIVSRDAPYISHVAALVADVDVSIAFLSELLGWGPWSIYDLVPPRLHHRVYRGSEGTFEMVGAETHLGPIDFALNQTLRGPSIYDEYLKRRGAGLHHLACMAGPSGTMQIKERFSLAGIDIAMAGRIDETIEFFYFDSETALGVAIESGSGHAIALPPNRVSAPAAQSEPPAALTEIALVVEDLSEAVEAFTTILDWHPWELESSEQRQVRLGRRRVDVELQTARVHVGAVTVELIRPTSGPSVERQSLAAVGPGLHHVGCRLSAHLRDRVRHTLRQHGLRTTLTTRRNGAESWYVDSTPRLKLSFD